MTDYETHSACARAIKLWKGDAPCCECTGHPCKPMHEDAQATETSANLGEPTQTPAKEPWEENFDKEFPMLFTHANARGVACTLKVKAFISKVDKEAENRGYLKGLEDTEKIKKIEFERGVKYCSETLDLKSL